MRGADFMSVMKTCRAVLLAPLLRCRFARKLLAAYLYRKWIAHSEAVVAARRQEETLNEAYWMGRLREYAHIVDKGLHRGDFSKGRGVRAYEGAKTALSHVRSREGLDDPSVVWATSRIRLYEKIQSNGSTRLDPPLIVTRCRYDDLLDAIKTRRSIRRYLDRPVEDSVVERIVEVLDWSPTSCNRQPGHVYATNQADIVRRCVQVHGGAACFTEIVAPLFLTFCADPTVYDMPAEVAMPYIDVALGVENCVLAAHCLGVSLTLLTWALHSDREDRELRRILGIPPHLQIIVSAVGGYPSGGAETPGRKNKQLHIVKQAEAISR